jgi:hypothetical protein
MAMVHYIYPGFSVYCLYLYAAVLGSGVVCLFLCLCLCLCSLLLSTSAEMGFELRCCAYVQWNVSEHKIAKK